MTAAYFVLGTDAGTRAALTGAGTDLDQLHALAAARVEAAGLGERVEENAGALVLVAHSLPGADRALAIERLATREPYLVSDRWTFFPAACALREDAARPRRGAAVIWGGSVAASRLHLIEGTARIGGDASCEVRIDALDEVAATYEGLGKHAWVAPAEGRRDLRLMTDALDQPRRFVGTTPLYIPAASPGRSSSVVILFNTARDVVPWARSGGQCSGWDDAIARYRLTEALARRGPDEAGLVLVRFDAAAVDTARWVERLAALPATVERSISCTCEGIAIVALGSHDDLVVYGDQVREHFADRVVRIVDWIAEPNETAHDTFQWLRSRL